MTSGVKIPQKRKITIKKLETATFRNTEKWFAALILVLFFFYRCIHIEGDAERFYFAVGGRDI